MIRIAVIDVSAESRNRITQEINSYIRLCSSEEGALVPQVSLKSLSPLELKFNAAPDVCIIGDELARTEPGEISRIRKLFADSALLVRTSRELSGLTSVDHFARLGADDVLSEDSSPQEFLRKLVLLGRKCRKERVGTLIVVDAAKGGLGVSSVSAGIAEALFEKGKKVAIVDCDFETQDLSRFLQARPFINDNLRSLFDGVRPVSDETVAQCLVPLSDVAMDFCCLPPPPESDDLHEAHAEFMRVWVAVLEVLDEKFDYVIVDLGSVRGALRKTFYRIADRLVYVINNDPATLFASIDRINKARAVLSAGARLVVVNNSAVKDGIPANALHEELKRAASVEEKEWSDQPISFSVQGRKWPGSGQTLWSCGGSAVTAGFENILQKLGCIPESPQRTSLFGFVNKYRQRKLALPESTLRLTAGAPQHNLQKRIEQTEEVRVALPAPEENPTDQVPEKVPATVPAKQQPVAEVFTQYDPKNYVSKARLAS